MTNVLETRHLYAAEFERIAGDAGAVAPSWLATLRRHAMERFDTLGFPTTRDEEWRVTSVAPIANRSFASGSASGTTVAADRVRPFLLAATSAANLVFVNGRYAPELSATSGLPDDIEVGTLSSVLRREADLLEAHLGRYAGFDDRAFVALNTALLHEGAFVRIPSGAVVESPIHVVFVSTPGVEPTATHPRMLVLAGSNSQARLVESYVSTEAGPTFTNAVTEVVLGDGAIVDHYKVLRESVDALHVGNMDVHLAATANFSSLAITLGGGFVRNEVVALLDGEGGECTLNGLYLVDGERLVDNHTTMDHAKAHCASHEMYKGILAGKGRGVFNGKIIVRQDAQKTDAKQSNKALLLSEDSQINTKPQLEILADDVKCTHGATVGQLDAEQLFYLQARGIGREDAHHMLIHAFASDVLNRVRIPELQATLETVLRAQLPRS